jgi:hypothetical protein
VRIRDDLKLEIARRAAAKYFDLGMDPSYLRLLDTHDFDGVPAVRMLRCVISAIEEA